MRSRTSASNSGGTLAASAASSSIAWSWRGALGPCPWSAAPRRIVAHNTQVARRIYGVSEVLDDRPGMIAVVSGQPGQKNSGFGVVPYHTSPDMTRPDRAVLTIVGLAVSTLVFSWPEL